MVITSARSAAPPTSSTSSTPAMSTPHAAAWPGVGKNAAVSSVATMVRLSRIGAAAAVANLPRELRMPENNVTSVISRRYGNVMRVSVTASVETRRVIAKPGRQQPITAGVNSKRNREQHDLARQQHCKDAVAEQFCGIGPALLADARVGRHEGGRECALGKDRAEMVRQAERDEERIRDRSRAEHRRHHDVAHEAGHARDEREAADGEDAVDQ